MVDEKMKNTMYADVSKAKIVDMDNGGEPRDATDEEKEYLSQNPNRLEVANYVNSLLEHQYVPMIMSHIQLSSMVLQAILIEKKVCTGEEIEAISKQFVEEQMKRAKEEMEKVEKSKDVMAAMSALDKAVPLPADEMPNKE